MPSATVVSLINMKGGVGKTTLAVGLAWELAKKKRVLLVDIDPQFNATQWIVDPSTYLNWLKTKHTVLNVFQPQSLSVSTAPGAAPAAKPTDKTTIIPVKSNGKTLHILPSAIDLMKLDCVSF
jgi:chromosome partitioning protein